MEKRLVIVSFLLGVSLTALGFMSFLYFQKENRPSMVSQGANPYRTIEEESQTTLAVPDQRERQQVQKSYTPPAAPQALPQDQNLDQDNDQRTTIAPKSREQRRAELRKKLREENRNKIRRYKNRPEDMDKLMQAFAQGFNKDMNDIRNDDFEQSFRKMRERMRKIMESQGLGGAGLQGFGLGAPRFQGGMGGQNISQSEDKKNIYFELDLKNVDEDSLEVNIKEGQVTVSGQSVTKEESQGQNGYSASSSVSSFSQSFPVPYGVKEDGVSINKVNGKLRIKFPKNNI